MPSTSISLPPGSGAANISSEFGIETVAISALESLANGASTSSLAYANPGSATNCKVVLNLAPIAMASSGTVAIDNGTDLYEITVPSGTSGKKVEWNDIPATFLASFTVVNNLGVAFRSSGNSLTIIPIY